MKADKNFKLTKTTKRMLSTMTKEQRRLFKDMMISAELSHEANKKKQTNKTEKE